MAEKNKTVHYRRCNPLKSQSSTGALAQGEFDLEKALREAMPKNELPWKRPELAGSTRSHHLTTLIDKNECLCGVFIVCDRGKKVPLVDVEADGSTWQGAVDPKDDSGKKRELQEQMLIFAIKSNHVAVIQSVGLTIEDFKDFLVWFIQTRAKVCEGWFFNLQNIPSQGALEKMKGQKISAIRIGKDAYNENREPMVLKDGTLSEKRFTKTIEADGVVKSWLQQVGLLEEALIDDPDLTPDVGQIWLELEIRYKAKKVRDSQKVMRAIASTLGDRTDLSPEIDLGNGGTIKAGMLTVKDQLSIQAPFGNLSGDDAMTQVSAWLSQAIKDKRVPSL